MNRSRSSRVRASDLSEWLPLGERMAYVEAVRVVLASMVVAAVALKPSIARVSPTGVLAVTGAYLVISAIPHLLARRNEAVVAGLMKGLLLVDGIYLAWVTLHTGAASSPFRFLFFIELIVVTLLVSYRTGIKLAVWFSLLYLVVVQFALTDPTANPADIAVASHDPHLVAILTVVALWIVALTTALFSALSERELRRQKADLGHLVRMTAAIENATSAADIPSILLDGVCRAFGFTRGVVLASATGDLQLLGATADVADDAGGGSLDDIVQRAWATRMPQLARTLDDGDDPRLAGLLAGAANVVVAPMFLGGGPKLGVLAVEHRARHASMRRWELSMLMQFASQAALALHNAWLSEERAAQLEEIRVLQREVLAHNARLEIAVAERTEELRTVIAELEAVDEQRRRLLSHIVDAQEDERQRIANDIHDDPLQKLVAAKMRVELVQRKYDGEDLLEVHEIVRSCIKSLRFLLFDLRPPILDERGLGPAIERFIEHWDIGVAFTVVDDLLMEVPAQTRVILYRIAQEALANIRKHAEATHVGVELKAEHEGLTMVIADDGVGCRPEQALAPKAGHLGLVAMRERAEMAGGRCQLFSLPGAGTTLEVWLPTQTREQTEQGHLESELAQLLSVPSDKIA